MHTFDSGQPGRDTTAPPFQLEPSDETMARAELLGYLLADADDQSLERTAATYRRLGDDPTARWIVARIERALMENRDARASL